VGINKQGGIDYNTNEQNEKAKEADLLTLPEEVEGTNCSNCKYITILDAKAGKGHCNHPKVRLNVTKRMCCALWDNKDSIRSFKKGN